MITIFRPLRRLTWALPILFVGCFLAAGAHAENAAKTSMADLISDMQVHISRLEQANEQLTGQMEELRFKNAQMAKQLQQLQDDLSLRVAALEQAAGGRPALPVQAPQSAPTPAPTVAPHAEAMPSAPTVYDPNAPMSTPVAKQPDMDAPAPPPPATAAKEAAMTDGAPPTADNGFVIRTDAHGKALPPDPNAPKLPPPSAASAKSAAPPVIKAPPAPAAVGADSVGSSGGADVALPKGSPKQQYDYATDFLRRQDFARAEVALRAFLKANPSDPLAGNAQYWLAQSLFSRGDYQQAAVEFMAGYQNYRKSTKTPDNLLGMGKSLENMRQIPGACTAFDRIAKEFPDADDKIRREAQAERAKLKCSS